MAGALLAGRLRLASVRGGSAQRPEDALQLWLAGRDVRRRHRPRRPLRLLFATRLQQAHAGPGAAATAGDFLNWSGLRTVIDQDLDDPTGTEFYSAGFDPVRRTEGGLHVIMLQTFLTDVTEPYAIADARAATGEGARAAQPRCPPASTGSSTPSWPSAAIRSPGPVTESRSSRAAKRGPGDYGMVYADGPILHEDRLMFFYMAGNLTHNGYSARPWEGAYSTPNRRGKGLALLRPDGYVSVEAESYAPAILTTQRFRQEEGRAASRKRRCRRGGAALRAA